MGFSLLSHRPVVQKARTWKRNVRMGGERLEYFELRQERRSRGSRRQLGAGPDGNTRGLNVAAMGSSFPSEY